MILTVPVTVTDTQSGEKATASATGSVRIPFGVNTQQYANIAPSLSGITLTKSFTGTGWPNGVPSSWPGNNKYPPPPGTTTLACFNPAPQMVVSGQLDGPLSTFFGQAPPGSWATAWQEGDDNPGNGFWSQPGASASLLTDMHAYLHGLKQQVNPGILYGEDFGAYPAAVAGKDITPYVCPGLDFYSVDGYQNKATQTAANVFGVTWQQIVSVVPGARPAITECNTTVDTTGAWFQDCYSWLIANRGVLFTLWYGVGTHYTYPWPPSAQALAVLQSISQDCAA